MHVHTRIYKKASRNGSRRSKQHHSYSSRSYCGLRKHVRYLNSKTQHQFARKKNGKIDKFIPQLSTKGQVGPSTFKLANLVPKVLFLGHIHPLTFKSANLVLQVSFFGQSNPSNSIFIFISLFWSTIISQAAYINALYLLYLFWVMCLINLSH